MFKRFPRTLKVILLAGLLCFAINARSQMRQVYVDPSAPDNEMLNMSFYSAAEGFAAFDDWVGYTTDSARTFVRKYITTGNVNYNGYSVNLTFGFSINGVKAFSNQNLLVYGDYGFVPAILRSVDGGNSFTLVFHSRYDPFQLYTGITDMIFPENGSIGYATDADRILKTTNGGQSWVVNRTSPGSFFDRLEAVNNNQVYAMSLSYNYNNIIYTTNGISWQQLNKPTLNTGKIRYAFFLTATNGWMSMTDDDNKQYFYRTINGGSSWTLQNDPVITPMASGKFRFTDANTGYALYDQNTVYKTTNAGILWEPLPRDNNYSYLGFGFNNLFFWSANHFWAGGSHIEISTNAGGTTLPKAYYKIDTTGVTLTNNVTLINYSKPSYSHQWFLNGSLVSTSYNASYTHDIYRTQDTIKLVVNNGTSTDTLTRYQHYPPPVIVQSFTPNIGGTNSEVMISGLNFNNVTGVTFGGVPANSFTTLSSTSIRAFVGNGATGSVAVRTETGYGTRIGFTFLPAPTINSFSPVTATAGTSISITGTNFTNATEVLFAGIPSSFTVVSSTQITAIAPSGAGGNITVVTPGGSASLGGYAVIPTVTGFYPQKGTQGTMMGIKGTSFSAISAVSVGAVLVQSFIVHGPDSITAIVAAGASGNVSVVASTGNSSMPGFTWVAAPVITGFAPSSGAVGTTVTITGTGFSSTPQNNLVNFGPVRATVTASTASSITVIAPPGATFEPISVMNNDLVAFSRYPFVVTFPGGSITENSFANPVINHNPDHSYQEVKVADLNGDGKSDLVFSYSNGGNIDAGLVIYRNTSTASVTSFADPVHIFGDFGALALGDLDADGKPELVSANSENGYIIKVFKNTSTITDVSFAEQPYLATPDLPTDIVIMDVDADGKPDIITEGYPEDGIIYRNISNPGKIAFAPYITHPALGGRNMVLADVTGDLKPEIIVPDAVNFLIRVLKNTSSINNISFEAPVELQGYNHSYITTADINGDGKTDLVTGDQYGSKLYLLRNIGSGNNIQFAAGVQSDFVSRPGGIVAGDFDGDGKVDIATSLIDKSMAVFKNISAAGDIILSAKKEYGPTVDFASRPIAAADINNDGKTDIISISFIDRSFYVHINKVKPEPFVASFTPTIGETGTTVTITGANFSGTTNVSFGGVPASSFIVISPDTISAIVGSGGNGSVMVTNSFGNDSKPGFAFGIPPSITSISATSGPVGTALTIYGNRFSPIAANNLVRFGSVTATVTSATTNSINIIVPAGPTHKPFSVTINNLTAYSEQYFNTTFTGAAATISSTNFAEKINGPSGGKLACDIDGDGKVDIVSVADNTIKIFRNTSSTPTISFGNAVQFNAPNAAISAAFGDLDGDGKQDMVTLGSSMIGVWKNNGSAANISFSLVGTYYTGLTSGGAIDLAVGDLDKDGKPEIAVANYSAQTIAVFKNKSNNGQIIITETDRIEYNMLGYPTGIGIRDIDADQKPDLIVVINASNSATVLRNIGTPGNLLFDNTGGATAGNWPNDLECSDIDGDGKPDLLVSNINGSNISVFKNTSSLGNVSMLTAQNYSAGQGPNKIVVGDLDGDGKPDAIVDNRYAPTGISILKNASGSSGITLSPRFFIDIPGTVTTLPELADFDNDGAPDLLVCTGGYSASFIYRNMTGIPLLSNAICPNGNISISSSISGSTYQWQLDSGAGFTNISNGGSFSGATTANLLVTNIPSSWYGYKFRCITNNGTSANTVVQIANQWTGAVNNFWNNAANWSCGVVPDGNTDVVINSGTVILNSMGICRSIRIAPGAVFTVGSGYTLTITH